MIGSLRIPCFIPYVLQIKLINQISVQYR
uniref:Uncharacterized protein n=1 Tax=Arundo donax TaxID=35708 RepID=A0A0A9H9Q4_ARUDO